MWHVLQLLFLDPVRARQRVSGHWGWLILLVLLSYLYLCGWAFQYLYPRMLDQIPALGTWRRIASLGLAHGFYPGLFLRGLLMGLVVWASLWGLFGLLALLPGRGRPRKGKSASDALTAPLLALGTCSPFVVTVVSALVCYNWHPYFGFLPLYGLFVSTCRLSSVLHHMYRVERFSAIWLAPLIMLVQLLGSWILLPS